MIAHNARGKPSAAPNAPYASRSAVPVNQSSLIAAAFAMRPSRGRRIAAMVLGGFGAGLGLFFLRNLAQVLGETGQVPPAMAAFAPIAVAVMLALALLLKLEEG